MSGDYRYYQDLYSRWSEDLTLTGAAISTTALETAKSANHQVYFQRGTLSITTHVAGKVFTLQSSNGTPVVIYNRADLAAAAGVPDIIEIDFGPEGIPVAVGENLCYVANTAGSGFVGRFHGEGYQKLIGPVTIAQAAAGG